jgi:hypothetical protein
MIIWLTRPQRLLFLNSQDSERRPSALFSAIPSCFSKANILFSLFTFKVKTCFHFLNSSQKQHVQKQALHKHIALLKNSIFKIWQCKMKKLSKQVYLGGGEDKASYKIHLQTTNFIS